MSEPAQVFHVSKPQILWSLTEFTLQQLQHTQPHTLNTQSVSLDYTCYCKTRHRIHLCRITCLYSHNNSPFLFVYWFILIMIWRSDQNNMLILIITLWINVYSDRFCIIRLFVLILIYYYMKFNSIDFHLLDNLSMICRIKQNKNTDTNYYILYTCILDYVH